MVKPSKLYERVSADPSLIISFRDFERLLTAAGFRHERTTGSHRHFVHPKVAAILTVSPDRKDANRYQVRRLVAIMREYGLSIGE